MPSDAKDLALFYPELLSESALNDLVATLDKAAHLGSIHIATFFCSVWALQTLKDHPLFKIVHIYTLSLNDKLREFPILQVYSELDPVTRETWLEARNKQMLLKAKGAHIKDPEDLFNARSCFRAFFGIK